MGDALRVSTIALLATMSGCGAPAAVPGPSAAAPGAPGAIRERTLRGSAERPGLGAAEVPSERIEVGACAGGRDRAEQLAALAIVEDFRVSAREMIVCGTV